uniref:Mucin-20 n=1 Tax=Castor canadensis TaxID=51338 RepID=A0A8C0VY06_CASCN
MRPTGGSAWALGPLLWNSWLTKLVLPNTGPSTSRPFPLVTTSNTEVPAMTQGIRTRSEGTFQTTDLAESSVLSHASMQTLIYSTETVSKTLIPSGTPSEAEILETTTMAPTAETGGTLTKSPMSETLENMTIFPGRETLGTLSTSAAETGGFLTTSPEPETHGTPTTSTAVAARGTPTTSLATEIRDFLSTSLTSEDEGTQTIFSASETEGTPTSFPASGTLGTLTTSSTAETTSLSKIITSNLTIDIITRGSPTGHGTSTVRTGTGSNSTEVMFDTLPTRVSTEETKKIMVDQLTQAHTSKEAESLSSESSSSSNSLAPALTTSQALSPDIWIPVKTLVAYSTAHIEPTNYSTEIETASPTFRTSDTDQRSTEGVTALSTSETSALPPSTEAKSHIPKATAFADASESASPATTLEATLPTSCTTERKTTATKASTHSGALGTVTSNPFKETSDPSVETSSHAEVSGSTEAGSAVGKVTSLAGPSASTSSPSEVAPIENFTYSVTFDTDSTTIGSFPISRRLPPSVHPTLANSSRDRNITSAKATTSPRTPMKPPTSMPTTASVKQTTGVSGDGGFLLVRLSVASPEDLTEPRLAERLMKQLRYELRIHVPLVQVSLLRVKRV